MLIIALLKLRPVIPTTNRLPPYSSGRMALSELASSKPTNPLADRLMSATLPLPYHTMPLPVQIYLTASEYQQFVKSGHFRILTTIGEFHADEMIAHRNGFDYVELRKQQFRFHASGSFLLPRLYH
jgi:hypothetical protein